MLKVAKVAFFFAAIAGFSFALGQAANPDGGVSPAAASSAPTAAVEWPQVILNVLVDMKKGATAPILASSLEIFEDDTQQEIESIAGPGSPVSLCLDIDISGSMTSKKEQVARAAKQLVKSLPPGSEVMVSVFADEVYLAAPFTPAEAIDLTLFDRFKIGHRTALSDSLVITEPYFTHFARYPRRALVLITDGGDNASKHGNYGAIRSMEVVSSPFVYVLEIFDPYAQTPEERAPYVNMFPSTGVRIVRMSDLREILLDATGISQCIDDQYALSYRSRLTTPDKRLHKIQVRRSEPDPRIKIESLPGYYFPSK